MKIEIVEAVISRNLYLVFLILDCSYFTYSEHFKTISSYFSGRFHYGSIFTCPSKVIHSTRGLLLDIICLVSIWKKKKNRGKFLAAALRLLIWLIIGRNLLTNHLIIYLNIYSAKRSTTILAIILPTVFL